MSCTTIISLTFILFSFSVSPFRVQFGRCCRVAFFKGLYRKNPAGANIGLLALEWANYFFTIFIIVVRMVRVCVCAMMCNDVLMLHLIRRFKTFASLFKTYS